MSKSLTFKELREKNLAQYAAFFDLPLKHGDISKWLLIEKQSLTFRLKSILDHKLRPSDLEKFASEAADTVLLLDLVLAARDQSLEDLVRTRFNQLSERRKLDIKL